MNRDRQKRPKSYVDVQGNGLRVTAGQLGIGQSAPDAPLHIEGGVDAELNRLGYMVIGTVAGPNLNFDDNEIMARNNGAASTLHLQANGGGLIVHNRQAGSTRFVIKDDGKVGFGTNNPTTQLSLGRSLQARLLALHDNPDSWYGFGIRSGQMRLHIGNPNARFAFFAGDQEEVMTVRGNGNVEVDGTVRASALQTRLYTATGTRSVTFANNNRWAAVPDCSVTVNVSRTTNVIAFYQVTMAGGDSHLVTRLRIGRSTPHFTRSITGDTTYWAPSSVWMGSLNAGNHTFTVEYRTPQGASTTQMGLIGERVFCTSSS